MEKNQLEFYWKKNLLKKSNIPEARQTMKILGVAISNHIISFRFLPISGQFQTTQENQNWLIRARRISCNQGGKAFDYLKRISFWSQLKKFLILF